MVVKPYLYLGAILLWIATGVGAFFYGKYDQRQEYKDEQGEQAVELVERISERIPEVREQDRQASGLDRETQQLREELRRAIQNNQRDPSCDLSDDEFRLFQELGERTRVLPSSSLRRD